MAEEIRIEFGGEVQEKVGPELIQAFDNLARSIETAVKQPQISQGNIPPPVTPQERLRDWQAKWRTSAIAMRQRAGNEYTGIGPEHPFTAAERRGFAGTPEYDELMEARRNAAAALRSPELHRQRLEYNRQRRVNAELLGVGGRKKWDAEAPIMAELADPAPAPRAAQRGQQRPGMFGSQASGVGGAMMGGIVGGVTGSPTAGALAGTATMYGLSAAPEFAPLILAVGILTESFMSLRRATISVTQGMASYSPAIAGAEVRNEILMIKQQIRLAREYGKELKGAVQAEGEVERAWDELKTEVVVTGNVSRVLGVTAEFLRGGSAPIKGLREQPGKTVGDLATGSPRLFMEDWGNAPRWVTGPSGWAAEKGTDALKRWDESGRAHAPDLSKEREQEYKEKALKRFLELRPDTNQKSQEIFTKLTLETQLDILFRISKKLADIHNEIKDSKKDADPTEAVDWIENLLSGSDKWGGGKAFKPISHHEQPALNMGHWG